ncbi:ATP synthase F1 subunit delta [Phycisphaerales bacterium AB-hyl4]|uniref:ATP synthase subunit delta n=1 Tax=Natronomicrosphaera hydrolytica TaxID=3242702 RepID=A0ABV4U5U5_9BACT
MTTTTKTNAVDRAYAQALFEMGEAQSALDALAGEVDELGTLITDQPDLGRLLSSRTLAEAERSAMIERLFNGNVSDLLYRFLQVVNRKGRLNALPGIVQAFSDLIAEKRGIVEVDAFVAARMDDAQAADVAATIGKHLNKEIVLHQYVDESLIGGIKLRVGDKVIDGSVATQLRLLKQNMINAGREKARQRTND